MQAMFKKALLLALVLPALSASAAPEGSTPATSAETMQISSWHSEVAGGSIIGGIQTVTIVSTAAATSQTVVFRLEAPPCDCRIPTVVTSHGVVENGIWTIDELQPGATATLELSYVGRK
jgi:hypothetical protein